MKRLFVLLMASCSLFCCGNFSLAASGHYNNGGEGIRVASLPPSGFYYKLYNMFYSSTVQRTNSGQSARGDFKLNVYAQAHRFIWSSDIKVLGGNLLFDAIVPLVYTDIANRDLGAASFSDSQFGLGDIFLEPLLIAWHGDRWDALAAAGVYVPSGEFKADRPASPGMGFWTVMFSTGGTVYLDRDKSWSASALFRYQVHTKQSETHVTPGNHLSFEWGVGKNINGFDIGAAGYCLWQVTKDSGGNSGSYMERAYAAGPEIGYTFDSIGLNVALRSVWEFETRNRPQGNMTSLNLTYAF